jgi:hypothetical protein
MNEIGRYRVERPLGAGAFAVVWLCHDDALDAPVAVKVLAENWSHQLDVRSRFVEEARILRRADSSRLVPVLDMGELADGRPYFVMAYADRGTLADRLLEGPLPVAEALLLAAEVARGAADLHQLDVIHRDLKPSNVLFQSTREGGERALVADLGLAKALAHASGLTLTAGSPGYMAPEQARPGTGLDLRADVHALGALAYHLLTGAPPSQLREPPSTLRDGLPAGTDEVVLRALAPDREDRWPSATDLAQALAALPAGVEQDAASTQRDRANGDAGGTAVRTAAGKPAPKEAPEAASVAAALVPAGGTDQDTEQSRDQSTDEGAAPGAGKAAKRRRRPRRRFAVGAVAVVLVAGAGAAGTFLRGGGIGSVTVGDGSGRLSITVPRAWAGEVRGAGWSPRSVGLADEHGAALAVAPELDRWAATDDDTPGVFVGETTDLRGGELPPKAITHPGCSEAGKQPYEQGRLRGIISRWVGCGEARMSLSEVGLYDRDQRFALYVQIKQPAGIDRTVEILDSLQVLEPGAPGA